MKKIIVLCLIFLLQNAFAQEGANQKITIKNFKLTENEPNFFNGEKGLKCEFDVYFSEIIKDFFNKSYAISWRLEDASGKIVFNSKDAQDFGSQSTSASAEEPFGVSNPTYGLAEGVDLFIAYKDLNLPNGKNTCKLILSAEHKAKNLPDFYTKEISFTFKKITVQPSDKQTFAVKNLKFTNQTGIGFQKLDISYTMCVAYGPGQVPEKEYPIYWKLLDDKGKEVYNSEQDFFTQNKKLYLSEFKEDKTNGGYSNEEFTGVEYKYLTLAGKQTLTFVLSVEHLGKLTQIHEEKTTITLPDLHRFEEQEFEITNLSAKSTKEDGVSGVKLTFNCKFKYNKIADGTDTKDYYFYLKINNGSADIYNPESDEPYKKYAEYAIVDYMTLSAKSTSEVYSNSIFVPYFAIQTKLGQQDVNLTLHATDSRGAVKFKQLGKAVLSISKPKTLKASFDLTDLYLVEKEYDAAFGDNYEKRKPDTQWSIMAGNFSLYSSDVNDNDYSGIPDKVNLEFSEGDEIELVISDFDKFLNPTDVLSVIPISYTNKVADVKNYSKGDVKRLSYSLKVE